MGVTVVKAWEDEDGGDDAQMRGRVEGSREAQLRNEVGESAGDCREHLGRRRRRRSDAQMREVGFEEAERLKLIEKLRV